MTHFFKLKAYQPNLRQAPLPRPPTQLPGNLPFGPKNKQIKITGSSAKKEKKQINKHTNKNYH